MVFVDTWAWLALAVRTDQHHAAAKQQQTELVATGREYVTTDYVLSELITQLYRITDPEKAETYVATILAATMSGKYRLERVSAERFEEAWALRRQYSDKPTISFVDLTSFVTMRDLGIQDVFTGDHHFAQVNLGFRLLPQAT